MESKLDPAMFVSQPDPILGRGLEILGEIVRRMKAGERIEIGDARATLAVLRFFGEGALVDALDEALKARKASDFVRGSNSLSQTLQSLPASTPAKHPIPTEVQANLSRLEGKYMISDGRRGAARRQPAATPL